MKQTIFLLAISIATSSLVLTACENKSEEAPANAQQDKPPAAVEVMSVKLQKLPLIKEFSGRIVASEVADVRPQVTGVVEEIKFEQGGMVQKGQPLYKLNPENYQSTQGINQAGVLQAQANIETAKASYENSLANVASRVAEYEQAIADYNRIKPLLAKQAISQQQVQQAQTRVKTAKAAVNSAQAAAKQAKANVTSSEASLKTAQAQLFASRLDLSRTVVKAPITGITERSNVTAGALVNANQSQPLVTITKLNPMYVEFNLTSSELINIKTKQSSGELGPGGAQVELVLEDGTTYPEIGKLSLIEAKVNQENGAITWRATFPNDNHILLPGMYVNARIILGTINNAALLPQSAVTRTAKGEPQVYVVDKDNKAMIKPISIDGTYQGQWVVTDGLNAGDKVVVIGGSRIRPQDIVKPQPFKPATKASNSNANAGSNSRPLNTVATSSGPIKNPSSSKKPTTNNGKPNNSSSQ